jgi:hypothetical protein
MAAGELSPQRRVNIGAKQIPRVTSAGLRWTREDAAARNCGNALSPETENQLG